MHTDAVENEWGQWGLPVVQAGDFLYALEAPGDGFVPPMDLRRVISGVQEIPPMPDLARQVLELAANEHAGAAELAYVVESDPGLAAQVVRWAGSPLFGYRGRITTVHQAISRVLGYEMVWNLAIGLATMTPLRIPAAGPLGLDAVWRHSVYSAELMERLARRMPVERRLRRGVAYLAGLLQDIGLLLLGDRFAEEYRQLSRLVERNPGRSVVDLARFSLGLDHGTLALWLMRAWGLPEELQVAASYGFDGEYKGAFQTTARLTLLSNRLLASERDVFRPIVETQIADGLLAELQLSRQEVEETLEGWRQQQVDMDALARNMAV